MPVYMLTELSYYFVMHCIMTIFVLFFSKDNSDYSFDCWIEMSEVCQIYIHQLSDEIIYIPLATQVISYNENLKKNVGFDFIGVRSINLYYDMCFIILRNWRCIILGRLFEVMILMGNKSHYDFTYESLKSCLSNIFSTFPPHFSLIFNHKRATIYFIRPHRFVIISKLILSTA